MTIVVLACIDRFYISRSMNVYDYAANANFSTSLSLATS